MSEAESHPPKTPPEASQSVATAMTTDVGEEKAKAPKKTNWAFVILRLVLIFVVLPPIVIRLLPPIMSAVAPGSGFGAKPDDVDRVDGGLSPCESPINCVCSVTPGQEYFIEPITYRGTPEEAQEDLEQALSDLFGLGVGGLTLIGPDLSEIDGAGDEAEADAEKAGQPENYLYVPCHGILGFVDDMEFVVQPDGKIDVRSSGRFSRNDLGANRRRVEKVRELFNGINADRDEFVPPPPPPPAAASPGLVPMPGSEEGPGSDPGPQSDDATPEPGVVPDEGNANEPPDPNATPAEEGSEPAAEAGSEGEGEESGSESTEGPAPTPESGSEPEESGDGTAGPAPVGPGR